MSRAALIPLLALCGCDPQGSTAGPTVTVLRETADKNCHELLAGPAPAPGLGAAPCTTAVSGKTGLLAGIDRVQLVIDYGELDIPASATIPPPLPAVYVDGVAVAPAPGVQSQPRASGHIYFLGSFVAPKVISNNVTISVPVVDGYGAAVATIFQTVDPPISVSVLQRVDAGCYMPLGAAPAAELRLDGVCAPAAAPAMNAGLDTLRVVVDYGAPDIAASTVIPAPAVSLSVDGVTRAGALDADVVHSDSGRRYVSGLVHAPAPASPDVRIAVKALATSPSATEVRLATVAPRPALRIVECPEPPADCEATAAVGALHLVASLPGDVSRTVNLHSILDGVVQPDPPAITTSLVGYHTEGPRTVDVPSGVRDGATWILRAQLEGEYSEAAVVLRAPAITATVTPCASPCVVTVGTPLKLAVVAPRRIEGHRATYTTELAGIPGGGGSLDLADDNDAARGNTTIFAPATPGEWRIDVTVATYAAQTIVVNVAP